MHFNETVNNYHRHHFDINKQTEAKGLRSWATDGIGITHMYKQLVMESKRQETKQTEEYINHLVHNFIHELTLHAQKLKDVFDKCRSRVNAYNPMCTPLMSVEFEDYEAKKEIKERRGDPTWLKTHGDRPHHTLGLPRPQKPLPTGDQTSFQGGRNLYESYINERKSALNQPKYTYKIQGLQDQTEAKVRAEAARRLELPQRR